MTNFKIQGVGLDTTNIQYPLPSDEHYDYLITDLRANNDFCLENYNKSSILIVKTDYLDSVELSLMSHLKTLKRNYIPLLLVEETADWSKAEKLSIVGSIGISHPSTPEKIKEVDSVLKEKGLKLEYVLLSACPLDYDKEILEEIKNLGLTLIVDNPMGGYLSGPRNIKAFSVPYLLSFAANLGEIVVVSGRDIIKAAESRDYLKDHIGKPSNPIFKSTKTVKKPVKEIKKVIYASLEIGDNIIPYENPTALDNTVLTIGKELENLPDSIETKDPESIEGKIQSLLKITHIPTDASKESLFTHLRYRIENYIEGYLDGYDLEYIYQGSLMMIEATKPEWHSGFLWWYKYLPEEKRYFCFVLGDNPVFFEINSPEDPSKSLIMEE